MNRAAWITAGVLAALATVGTRAAAPAPAFAAREIHVSPAGNDAADGSANAPFRTPHRAQAATREALKDMRGDLTIVLAAGDYRLDRTLEFTEADSGRNGFRVVWRSAAGPGKAHLLGSVPLTGWKPVSNGIWSIGLPTGTVFHTLYENGRRAHKARFPNLETDPGMPVALGRYLVSVDGTPKQDDKGGPRARGPGWLQYGEADAPPVTAVTKMRLHLYPGGICDWVREVHAVTSIDPAARRIVFDTDPVQGVGTGARFFLDDEFGFLDAPGEFFVDEAARLLHYKPLGAGHPDALGIARPTLQRLVAFRGRSRDDPVRGIVLDGLSLEETDNDPPRPLWAYAGLTDGALVWMNNAADIEVRNCRLRNGGRSGVMMIGHNTGNLVTGCSIEHMGLNGVSLCNRFSAPGGKAPTADRCESNRVHNTRISHVGELHCYAECVTAFNVSSNEVDRCDLSHSVRYAVTVRGNTGAQYGPPVTTPFPPAAGNRFHHLRVSHCGQDGGDMGALHCANLNNPGGDSVNVFEQITVADTAAIPSMRDIPPNGIFLDWPKMAMHQVFRNVEIVRSQGPPLRSNGPDNGDSAVTENVSWKPGFRADLMDYDGIGLAAAFPAEYGGRPAPAPAAPAPTDLRAQAPAANRVELRWGPVAGGSASYVIRRDGVVVGRTTERRWTDRAVAERSTHRYTVAARTGDFSRFGAESVCEIATPADLVPPAVTGVRVSPDGRHVRVAFDEPVDPTSAGEAARYRFDPPAEVRAATLAGPSTIEFGVGGLATGRVVRLSVAGVADRAAASNRTDGAHAVAVGAGDPVVRYDPAADAESGRLRDTSGGGGDAALRGGARIEPESGPAGGAALVLDGRAAFAEGPADLNAGPGDFTLTVWVWKESGGVIVSKGNGFGRADQWSFGEAASNLHGSVSLRIDNAYFSTAGQALKARRWTHLAFVRCGREGRSYVDGEPSGPVHDLSAVGPLVNDRPLLIGRREYERNPMWFRGRVGGLAILPRALTPAEIRREAGAETAGGDR